MIIRAVVRPEGPRTTFSISLEVLQTGQLDLDIYSVDSAEERVNLISESQYRSIGQEMVLIRAVITLRGHYHVFQVHILMFSSPAIRFVAKTDEQSLSHCT